jgi:hypothetical protein
VILYDVTDDVTDLEEAIALLNSPLKDHQQKALGLVASKRDRTPKRARIGYCRYLVRMLI